MLPGFRPSLQSLSSAIVAFLVLVAGSARGEEATGSLAAKVQNPIADLISLPIQSNHNFGLGPHDRTQTIVNVQPVVPFSLGPDWNLVTRWIMPIVNQPNLASSHGATFGLGDFNPSFFLVPKLPGDVMVGFGPTLLFPTATSRETGSGKWGAGPTAVVVWMPKPWVVGVLANNIWSYAGNGDRAAVSTFLLQPFVNYNLPDGWYLTSSPVVTANWKAPSDDRWVVPIGGGVGKIWHLGHQPINTTVQAYWNVVHPETVHGPNWQVRAQFTLLFPK